MAVAAGGRPDRFLTLTVNPSFLESPRERFRALSHGWATAVKRLRRLPKYKNLEYFAVVEATKSGEPHLHILIRGGYIPHQLISKIMGELTHAPIVHIERVRGIREAVRYLAKYLTKAPARFGDSKRYWSSRHWLTDDQKLYDDGTPKFLRWMLARAPIASLLVEGIDDGYTWRELREGLFFGADRFALIE